MEEAHTIQTDLFFTLDSINNNNNLFPSLIQENTTIYVTVYVIVCLSTSMYSTDSNKFTINYTSVLTLLQYANSPHACLI